MNLQNSLTQLEEIEEKTDNLLIQNLSMFMQKLYSDKAIDNLLWISLRQSPERQAQLLKKLKRITTSYLENYFNHPDAS